MSDPFLEAFEDVLREEMDRQLVWVIGSPYWHSGPGSFYSEGGVVQAGYVVPSSNPLAPGCVYVQVHGWPDPWTMAEAGVYATREEAEAALCILNEDHDVV